MTIQKPRGDDESINICPTYVQKDNTKETCNTHTRIQPRTGKGRTYVAQHDHLQQQCDPTHQPTAASFLDKTFVFDNRKPLGEGRQQDMHDIPSTHDGISHLQIHPLTQS